MKNVNNRKKKVDVFKSGKFLGSFESCAELERQSEQLFGVKLRSSNITRVCNGYINEYKGFQFKYTK